MAASLGYKILIDGYNVIKRNRALSQLALEPGRRQLVAQASLIKWPVPVGSIIIVFDAKECEQTRHQVSEKVIVLFVPDADREIQREIRAQHPGQHYLLVSEDSELISTAKSHGVPCRDVSWFFGRAVPQRAALKKISQAAKAGNLSDVAARKITEELSNYWLKHEKK